MSRRPTLDATCRKILDTEEQIQRFEDRLIIKKAQLADLQETLRSITDDREALKSWAQSRADIITRIAGEQ